MDHFELVPLMWQAVLVVYLQCMCNLKHYTEISALGRPSWKCISSIYAM